MESGKLRIAVLGAGGVGGYYGGALARAGYPVALLARGYTNKAIGAYLNVSDRTVQGHLANIFGKLHVATRTEAVMRAVSLEWLAPGDTAE